MSKKDDLMIRDIFYEIYMLYTEMAPFLFIGLFFAGVLYLFVKKDFIAKHIGKNNLISVIKASLLGVPMPLCSCGVIPTALHLHKQKASRSAVISFLISTPQTGIDSIFATYGLMGPLFAVFRPIVALITGIFGGIASNIFLKEDYRVKEVATCNDCDITQNKKISVLLAFKYAFVDFLDDISLRLLLGIFIAGLISYFIPDNFFQDKISNTFVSMLVMILFGLPLYVCATGSIPIAVSLMIKGLSPGAAFVFLMVGPATNMATILIIGKSLGKKSVFIYLITIIVSALFFGTILNVIYQFYEINPVSDLGKMNMENSFYRILMILFSFFMIGSIFRKIKGKFKGVKMNENEKIFKVLGMTCHHCVKHVTDAILSVNGVKEANVALNSKTATIKGDYNDKEIIQAIENAGYKAFLTE